MLVSVWRHGEAGPGSPDRERTLTERGQRDLRRGGPAFVAELERRGLPQPGRVLFSRWRRTAQTAQALGAALAGALQEPLEALVPGRDPAAVDAALQPFTETEAHVVLVSHQPLVSELIDHWLGSGDEVPPLSPGAFTVIELPLAAVGCGSLVWWSSPPDYQV